MFSEQRLLIAVMLWTICVVSNAQSLPPIFADAPVQLVPAQVITQFPVDTFLENIAVDESGNLFVTSLEEGTIYRVTPEGERREFAQIDGRVAGLAFDPEGNLLVTGWAGGETPSVFRVSSQGAVETLAALEGAIFLNGITHLEGDRFLIADSYRGVIWLFNAQSKSYSIWLEDAALARTDAQNTFPGVNGIKVFNGTLYATNTDRQQILRIPIEKGSAGTPVVLCSKINGDDFAFDADGTLYVTTHVYNSVVRVTQDCDATIVAEDDKGVTGSTALAFGRGENAQAVFVVTNGGMSLPPEDGVQAAKVVRLEIGAGQ